MDDDQKRRAGQAVAEAMAAQGLSVDQLAKEAGVAPITVRYLCAGRRWPWPAKRNAIEASLGWEPGRITKIAQGTVPGAGETPRLTSHQGGLDKLTMQQELEDLLSRSRLSHARRLRLIADFLDLAGEQEREDQRNDASAL